LPLGLRELKFEIEFIEKIENISSLIENDELKSDVKIEVDWLLNSEFVFKISDKIFPYT
jgi:DNA-dependent RNA polymerase auxiliary subunit epsilon